MTLRHALLGLAAVLALLAFTVARPAATGSTIVLDFNAYYAAGAAALDGTDPYSPALLGYETHIPHAPRDADTLLPFVSPPPTLLLWSALARLPFEVALRIWNTLLALAFALIVGCSCAAFGIVRRVEIAGAALLAVTFVPLTSDVALGSAALPAFAAALLALASGDRTILGASVASACSALQPNVALVMLAGASRLRGLLMLLGGAALAFTAGALARGWGWVLPYLEALRAHASSERGDVIQLTTASIGYGFGMPLDRASLLGSIGALLAVAIAVAAMIARRDPMQRAAIACAALPFASLFFHEHDLLVLALPVIFCAFTAPARLTPLALLGSLLVAVNWLDFAQQPQGALQGVLLGFAFIAAFAACSERADGRTFAAALAGAALVLGGAWFGSSHPLPIWPDAMHAFTPDTHAGAAEIWKTEQLQTGLMRPDAAAAWLRTFSLAGCAIVLYVTTAIRYRRP